MLQLTPPSAKMNEATPRITAQYLEQFSNRMVRVVGKVIQLRGDEATIDAGGQIVLHLNRVCVRDISIHTVFVF
jgi:replication factor A3